MDDHVQPRAGRLRLSLDVSPELNKLLENLAGKTNSSKSDVLRRAISLMDVAVDAKDHGQKLYVAKDLPSMLEEARSSVVGGVAGAPGEEDLPGQAGVYPVSIREIVGI